jgi:hypothetical protein
MLVALLALAGVLEIAGLALAAVGFKRTWREHAPGQDYWQPEKARARSAQRRLRRMIGRPAPAHVMPGAAHMNVSATLEARAHVTWGPLPDPADPSALVGELHRRLNELHDASQRARFALDDERAAREAGDEAARAVIREEVETVVRSTQRVAVGGLRLQVAGWFLVLAGIVAGTGANICQAIAS